MQFSRWMLHWRLQLPRKGTFKASPLHYAWKPQAQYQPTVKLLGSFRLATGSEHLRSHCKFTGRLVETVPQSFRYWCASELTRQGISLITLAAYRYADGTLSYAASSLNLLRFGVWFLRILNSHFFTIHFTDEIQHSIPSRIFQMLFFKHPPYNILEYCKIVLFIRS